MRKLAQVRLCIALLLSQSFLVSPQAWQKQATIFASNRASFAEFGSAVAITDNYAVVGAYLSSPSSYTEAGSANIFVRSGSTWTEQALLTARTKGDYDHFGTSVSLTDNYAFVGAPNADASTKDSGAGYVYVRSGSTWTEQAKLVGRTAYGFQEFGYSVSVTNNYALAGAPYASPNQVNAAGAAYVFVRSGERWTEQALLTASTAAPYDFLGFSVSLTDNYAVVGAPYTSSGLEKNAGAVHVFSRSAERWALQIRLTANDAIKAFNLYGFTVAHNDNYIMVVSLPVTFSRAYIYTRTSTSWAQQQVVDIPTAPQASGTITNNYAMAGFVQLARTGSTWAVKHIYDHFNAFSGAITDQYLIVGNPLTGSGGYAKNGDAYIYVNPTPPTADDSKTLSN